MHYTCRSFMAPGAEGFWSQYWENEPDDPSLVFNRGHLFGLVNIIPSESACDLHALGRELINQIDNRYFSADNNGQTPSNLRSILTDLIKDPQFSCCQITLSLVITQNRKLYLFCFGDSKIILKRRENIALLLSGNQESVSTLSGPLEFDDRLLLTTLPFYDQIGWEKIKLNLADPAISALEENFLSDLYSQTQTFSLAAALIQVNADDELTVETPQVPDPPQKEVPPQDPLLTPSVSVTPSPPPKPILSTKPHYFPDFGRFLKPRSDVYVSPLEIANVNRRKKLNLLLAFVILLGLGFSSYLGYRKNQSISAEKKYQSLKSEVEKKISNAQAVKNLNLESALTAAREANDLTAQMKSLNLHSDETSSLEGQIKTLLSLTGDSSQPVGEYFYDASLVSDSPQYRYLKINQGRIFLLDSVNGRLDSVGIQNHTKESLSSDPVLKNATGLAFDQSTPYLISANKLYAITSGKLESKTDLATDNGSVDPLGFDFWNGALYLLDRSSWTIQKYTPSGSTFGKPSNWLKDTKLSDKTSSFAINGKIWALTSDGKITPYNRGSAENFNLAQQSSVKSASKLVTTATSDFLAFVDNNSVVYVYRKNGDTVGRYNFDGKTIYDLVLDDSSSSLYLLCSDEKIYKLDL